MYRILLHSGPLLAVNSYKYGSGSVAKGYFYSSFSCFALPYLRKQPSNTVYLKVPYVVIRPREQS